MSEQAQKLHNIPLQITPNDEVILDFLRGSSNKVKIECINPEAMYNTLHRRVRVHILEGMKVHLWGGECILEIVDSNYKDINLGKYRQLEETRQRMFAETKERQKIRIKNYRTTVGSVNKKRRFIKDRVNNMVNVICFDFTESDREFLSNEIFKKLYDNHTKGKSYNIQAVAMIYLLSKCPSNSDRPLRFKEVYTRYCKYVGHEPITSFYDAIKNAKNGGVQTCRVTCEMIIMSKKDVLAGYAETNKIPQPDMWDIMKKAIDFTKLEKIKMGTMGRNPFVLSAAAIYHSRGAYNTIIQKDVGCMFGVTLVSIRHTIRRFNELVPPASQQTDQGKCPQNAP